MIQRKQEREATSLPERFLGVVMRQTEETSLAGEHALKLLASARVWRTANDDAAAIEAIDGLRSLDANQRWQIQRALMMAHELAKTPSQDPFPKLADELRSAGMKPLPKRPFPPYPQAFLHVKEYSAWSPEQARALAKIDALANGEDDAALDAELMRLWQVRDALSEDSVIDDALSDWLLPTLSAVNDDFANAVHIDPRFANFVPFVAISQEGYEPDLATQRRYALRALAFYHQELRAFYFDFAQDKAYALGGDRLESLRQRLTLGAPKLAQVVEPSLGNTPLRLVIAMMLAKLEAAFYASLTPTKGFAANAPAIQALWSRELLGEAEGYANPAALLRDLKHLHQAVGELYGGVALAPVVRRLLMTCGGHGFRSINHELVLGAGKIVGDLSELAMRSKLLDEPIDSYEGKEQIAALEKLFANIEILAEWAQAGATSESVKSLLAGLATIREQQRNMDMESTTTLTVEDCVQGADGIAALLLLHLDHHLDDQRSIGRPLYETISIIPEFAGSLDANSCAEECEALLNFPAYRAYAASRGGHAEIALADQPNQSPFAIAWRREAATLLMLNRAKAVEVVLTFMLPQAALKGFAADSLKSMVRLRNFDPLDSTLLRPALAASHARETLAEITRAIYLRKESENAGAYRSFLRMLAIEGASYAQQVFVAIEDSVEESFDIETVAPWTTPWLGSANALAGFLGGKIGFEGAPNDPQSRMALVQAARLECPAFALALDGIAEWLRKNDRRVLSLQAYRTLPKRSYGIVFPIIDTALGEAISVLDAIYPDAESAKRSEGAIEDAQWLLELANFER